MRKNATFIYFLVIKTEENAVKAAKNGKKSRKSRGAINFVAECPKSNEVLSKKSPRTEDVKFSRMIPP